MEKADIVADCVKRHLVIDKHLEQARKAAEKLAENVADGVEAGMMPDALSAKLILAKHRAAPGKIAEAAALFAELHIEGTAVSKANGVDLGSLDSVGGVKLPVKIQPLSGGR